MIKEDADFEHNKAEAMALCAKQIRGILNPGGKAPEDGHEAGLPPLTWPLGHPDGLTPGQTPQLKSALLRSPQSSICSR